MRILTSLLLSLCFFTGFAQKKPALDKRFAGLDTAFARVLKDWKAPGFAVAVVEKDRVIYAQGFGYKDFENKVPVTPNTVFAIGSCTKAFTSSLIGLLQKDGLVDYDKPVKTYLPSLNFYNNGMNENVSLRDMMCHRTGLSRYDYSWYFFPTASRDTLLKRMQFMEPSAPLRQKWQYNNFMFLLQGLVAEKLTGKSWEDNILRNFVAPLEMTNTTVNLDQWMKTTDKAYGYDLLKDSIIRKMDYYNINGMGPAGSINSSVLDMAKWITVWINAGKYQGKEILPSQYITEAISSQMVVSGSVPTQPWTDNYFATYGFGWMLSSYRGHYRVEHGGNIDGFSASSSFFPSDSIGIIVLTNQNRSSLPAIVRNLVADRVLGIKYRDWESKAFNDKLEGDKKAREAKKTTVSTRKTGTAPSHPMADYTGVFSAPGGETFEIDMKDDSLWIQFPADKALLQHYHYDVFNLVNTDDLKYSDSTSSEDALKLMFTGDENGNIVSVSLPLEAKPVVFTRTAKAIPMPKDSLERYTGDYTINGTTVRVYIKDENTMYLFLTGQPEYELIPTAKDKFKLKILNGYFVEFTTNDKGEVSEMTFIQPNGTFKAMKVVTR